MDKLYTIQEVAIKLNVSDKTLRRWEDAGKFVSSRTLGNQRRYSVEDLQILDAIKHGIIEQQSELLTIDQAGKLCGVSPMTILRWEEAGKIHPFITSLNNYYVRHKLVEKMEELKTIYVEPKLETLPAPSAPEQKANAPLPRETTIKQIPQLQTEEIGSLTTNSSVPNLWSPMIANALVSTILILTYHLLFNQTSVPVSPQTGTVQGATTISAPDPRVDDLITKFQDFVSSQSLKNNKPISTSTTKVDNTTFITGSATLPKGATQISVPADKVVPTTPITVSFTSDFAPAKKYWVTANEGTFTVSTDFPVTMSSTFNYSYLAPTLSPSPSSTPSAIPVL